MGSDGDTGDMLDYADINLGFLEIEGMIFNEG